MHHLEQEVKLDVGPEWAVPDLTGVLPGAQMVPLASQALEATYYDTADGRLEDRHITLRYRRERENGAVPGGGARAPEAHVWTVKLPTRVEGTALSRTEVNWDGRPSRSRGAARGAPEPLADASRFLCAVTLGEPLQPIARLATTRRRWELRTSDGRVLAEIDHDSVTGTNLLVSPGNAPGRTVSFTEVEVELSDGSALEVLDAVADRLVDAGASPSSRPSKLMTVMTASAAASAANGSGAGKAGVATAGTGNVSARRRPKAKPTVATLLREQAGDALDAILEHDPPIRLGDPDPEHVHRSRVATRRLRTVLRAFSELVTAYADTDYDDDPAEGWWAALNQELRWLGHILGRVRDADVRFEALEQACAKLPPADSAGASTVLQAARDDQGTAHADLLDAMQDDRYVLVLRALAALAEPLEEATTAGASGTTEASGTASARRNGSGRAHSEPLALVPDELWARLDVPAAATMPALGRRQWRSLRKNVRRLGAQPADEALHRVRIHAKRFRYIAETAKPVLASGPDRRSAERTVKAATELQDVLGVLHDSAVNEQWLRAVGARPAQVAGKAAQKVTLSTGVAAGQLIAMERSTQEANRQAWGRLWARLDDKKLLRWTGAP